MNYWTIDETAKKWGITPRQVRNYCAHGRIYGATLERGEWRIPADAAKPERKSRRPFPTTVLGVLDAERSSRISGGLYHRLQIDFTYNSNHIEGSRLTHEQTRWIFETKTIGEVGSDVPVDDIVETANHFRAIDRVISTAKAALTEAYVKRLHEILKSGTTDSRKEWFAVGDYKRLDNVVGEMETCPVKNVRHEMAKLMDWWKGAEKSFENLLDLHVRFEQIHPFQDGNGRVGRLILSRRSSSPTTCASSTILGFRNGGRAAVCVSLTPAARHRTSSSWAFGSLAIRRSPRRHLQSRRSRKGRGLSDEGGSLDEHYEILQLCDYGNVEL